MYKLLIETKCALVVDARNLEVKSLSENS